MRIGDIQYTVFSIRLKDILEVYTSGEFFCESIGGMAQIAGLQHRRVNLR